MSANTEMQLKPGSNILLATVFLEPWLYKRFDEERVNFVWRKNKSSDGRVIISEGLLHTFFLYKLLHAFFLYRPESRHSWKSRGLRACPISIFMFSLAIYSGYIQSFMVHISIIVLSSLYSSMNLKPPQKDWKTIGYERGILPFPILIGKQKNESD